MNTLEIATIVLVVIAAIAHAVVIYVSIKNKIRPAYFIAMLILINAVTVLVFCGFAVYIL